MSGRKTAAHTVLRNYFHAKDENRPHMLSKAFTADAELRVVNNTDSINFPAMSLGREAIAETLVRRFNQAYENIYTFYLASPPPDARQFSCDWLVGMSDKESKTVRVGCGRYDWSFQAETPHFASKLVITIDAMQVLPPRDFDAVFEWLGQLNYPWASAAQLAKLAPAIELLAPVLQRLRTERTSAT